MKLSNGGERRVRSLKLGLRLLNTQDVVSKYCRIYSPHKNVSAFGQFGSFGAVYLEPHPDLSTHG